ncbi:hypothetical protein [Streptomyces sp. NPDC019539]|uniref:hypothetical protein n=1 Tax=Streptomyces sp. NPDC019539 TaxID=3365063 RepID=UPI0037AC89C2
MISVKNRGSLIVLAAVIAASTAITVPTVAAVTSDPQPPAVAAPGGAEDCTPLITQLETQLQTVTTALTADPADVPGAQTALTSVTSTLTELEDATCLCAEEVDIVSGFVTTATTELQETPTDIATASDAVANATLAVDVLQAAATCEDGQCDDRDGDHDNGKPNKP